MISGQLYSGLNLNLLFQPIWINSNIIDQYNDDPYKFKKPLLSCYLTYAF